MRAFHCDRFELPLPEGHRFPAAKYRLLRERVEAEGVGAPLDLVESPAATGDQLVLAHDPAYVARVVAGSLSPKEVRELGFPWSPQLVERSLRSVGGSIAAGRAALDDGAAASLAGGTHHAFRDRGEGFCVFNDVAVAIRVLQRERLVARAVVVDLDVHQGNGTAAIFADDPSVFTLSLHGARNFPLRKERSDCDVELPDGTGDDAYLGALEPALRHALETARADLAFYVAGADPYLDDTLGRLALTREGLRRRDALVSDACASRGLPIALVMGGGYARRIEDAVALHHQSLRELAARCR